MQRPTREPQEYFIGKFVLIFILEDLLESETREIKLPTMRVIGLSAKQVEHFLEENSCPSKRVDKISSPLYKL